MPRPPAASPPRFRRRGRWGRCSTYPSIARAAEAGQLQLFDAGVSLDADFLWFNLTEARARADTGRPWLRRVELRQAIAHAVDREVFANSVYLGLADPIHGPVTPGNRVWFSADAPAYPFDRNRARALLAEVGLIDRDGDGLLEDTAREDARFTLLTQRGSTPRERASAVLQEDLRQIGLTVDVVPLEFGALIEGVLGADYDAVYFGTLASDTDPAVSLGFWLSSGAFHLWNPGQVH